MTLRWIDGFDHYATAQLDEMGYSGFGGGSSIAAGEGRNGTAALKALNASNSIERIMGVDQQTWVWGGSFEMASVPAGGTYDQIVGFYDTSVFHVDVRVNPSGQIYVTRNGTQLGSTGTTVLLANQAYYIEVKVKIDDSTGTVEVKINGVVEINLTSQDTRNGGNATANKLIWGLGTMTGIIYYDDFYICDGTDATGTQGAPYNDFQGDLRIETLLPSGNGTTNTLDGSDGNQTDNYLLVDEAAPNDDTDYVESSDVGDKDTYAYGNLSSATGSVKAVMPVPYAKKTDAGVRSIVSIARLSGTEVDSAAKTLNTTYGYLPDVRTLKPGGGAWSISDVNSAEFGGKVNE